MNYEEFLQYIDEWDIEVYRECPDGWKEALYSPDLPMGIVRIYSGSFSDGKRKSAYFAHPVALRKILISELRKSREALKVSEELCNIDEDVSELYFDKYREYDLNVCRILSLLFGYEAQEIQGDLYYDLLDRVFQELDK